MPVVVGVRFKDSGKTYHFDPRDVPLLVGDWAVVETSRGPELGRIAAAAADLMPDDVIGELRPVLRRAGDDDWASLRHYEQYIDEALEIAKEKVREHRLPMSVIKAEYGFDGSRLTFFFTADKRVDFRMLVRDLARTFHARIELRQVGPRDEAKLLGGLGPCGRPLCCATFLPDFAQVSIKMAKDQDLPLNPTKVSGVCGRLLCCLSYEQEQYLEIKAELPQRGAWVQTPEGPGEVVAVNVVRETATVLLATGTTGDWSAVQIGVVTEQVAAEARSRNAAGITPITRKALAADDLMDREVLHELAQLEDTLSDAEPTPTLPPRALRPEATLAPTGERGRLNRPLTPPAPERPTQTGAPAKPKERAAQPVDATSQRPSQPSVEANKQHSQDKPVAPSQPTQGQRGLSARPRRPLQQLGTKPQQTAGQQPPQKAEDRQRPASPRGPLGPRLTSEGDSGQPTSPQRETHASASAQGNGGRRRHKRKGGDRS